MKKKIIRILLSPFIFLLTIAIMFAATIFILFAFPPIHGFYCFLLGPFIWLLREGGVDIEYPEPFVSDRTFRPNYYVGHFLTMTIHVWGPFYATWLFIKNGTILALQD